MDKEDCTFIIFLLSVFLIAGIITMFMTSEQLETQELVLGDAICELEHGIGYTADRVHVSRGLRDEAWYEVRCSYTGQKIVNNKEE